MVELADPQAARKRAAQRAERVAHGLADLDQWLRDLARTGLAGADRAGYGLTDEVAARLVDAQAPGVANAVRRLPGVAASGAGWTGRLLTELALLRLLVAGYERIDELPSGLASTIRARVGYPVRTKDVLATRPVRDRWNVLALRDEADDRLITRRVQLHGERSGRTAVVLSFSAGAQPLDDSLLPGASVDAELHFYPGARPDRAVVGERYGEPGPLRLPPGLSVAEAVTAWAEALAADPWTNEVPMLLGGVVPVLPGAAAEDGSTRGWSVIDTAGRSLPLRPGNGLWTLLSVSGGAPVTIAASYGAAGLRVASVLSGDRLVVL